MRKDDKMRECSAVLPHMVHGPACGCATGPVAPGRRGLLGLAAVAGVAALAPRGARAGSGQYEAMLVNCIDPRFTTGSFLWMSSHGLRDRYSHFVIAGGPIGAVHARFAEWHAAFWENLAVSVQLHSIRRVTAMTHRDCGAAKLAFGEAAVATRAAESEAHASALRAFRAEVARRQPGLAVSIGIMDLNGTVDAVA
ncbi:hypothetical protein J5Y09_21235 [Roseomonas sp. PWR1]|uniref:Carbonic anhydrase n=1 Tax=Roseomonas nitratireducens TaxID=2820810 RepID=A0ABS4B0A8_9PROT|nr:hypothetical protein [Neoroseomonas nitratireducens]MBP0466466.1 hypothetical protein [Neoroseomonas nitratireducens]